MDPDALLTRILSLGATLDEAIEHGHPVDEDAVYALAGLVMELDVWLAAGRRPPARWAWARATDSAPLLLCNDAASNDAAPRVRRPLARTRRTRPASAQLAFAFTAAEL
jgi:hypothetical protein